MRNMSACSVFVRLVVVLFGQAEIVHMKAVLQRVQKAAVIVDGEVVGSIDKPANSSQGGLLVLLGVEQGDTEADSTFLAQKTVELRIFADEEGKMNKSVADIGGSVLVVSQFTLIADWRKGRRPGFTRAAAPDEGNRLYLHFADEIAKRGVPVQKGVFGAHMEVSLVNDGPVTLLLDNRSVEAG